MELTEKLHKIWKLGARSILLFDFKVDYGPLIKTLGPHWLYLDKSNLFIGTNPPGPCKDHTIWRNQFSGTFCDEHGLEFSRPGLDKSFDTLLPPLNRLLDNYYYWPSPKDIDTFLEHTPDTAVVRKSKYKESLRNQLGKIITEGGPMFDVRRGFDVLEDAILPGKSVCFDLFLIDETLARYIVNIIALQLIYLVMTYRLVTKNTVIYFIVDEADPIVSEEAARRYEAGYNHLGRICKQLRAFGVQAIISSTSLG